MALNLAKASAESLWTVHAFTDIRTFTYSLNTCVYDRTHLCMTHTAWTRVCMTHTVWTHVCMTHTAWTHLCMTHTAWTCVCMTHTVWTRVCMTHTVWTRVCMTHTVWTRVCIHIYSLYMCVYTYIGSMDAYVHVHTMSAAQLVQYGNVHSLSHRSMTESYLNMSVYITLQYTEALNSEDPSLNGFSTVEIISVCTLVAQKPFVLWIQYR